MQQAEAETNDRRPAPSNSRELLTIHQLIDLTDKPIRLTRDDLNCSRVRSSGSNCICSCANGAITLVTTNDSYILDQSPLEDVQAAEANPSLAYLAMSNRHKIAVIDLVASPVTFPPAAPSPAPSSGERASKPRSCARVVNLASKGLSMLDLILWRWIDETVLGVLTRDALFVCPIEQTRTNHPALSALSHPEQLLSMEKVCDLHPNLGRFCQITDIQRDESHNLYAITGLHRPGAESAPARRQVAPTSRPGYRLASFSSSSLKRSFNSAPGGLSLANNGHSFGSLPPTDKCTEPTDNYLMAAQPERGLDDEICGLVQIHCRMRGRTQLIPAQAATFAACPRTPAGSPSTAGDRLEGPATATSTTLIAANRCDDKLRVHFIGMATTSDLTTNGQNSSPTAPLNCRGVDEDKFDFPISIVCSNLPAPMADHDNTLHVAMVATKHGQLFVCSIKHGTILLNVRATHEIITSTILESETGGLMVICQNGQVLLAQLNTDKLGPLMDEGRSIRPLPSFDLLNSCCMVNGTGKFADEPSQQESLHDTTSDQEPNENGLDVLESTKL